MVNKIIAIVGITGNQGASVADVFLNEPGWKVRGITRDPSKASSNALASRGAEMVFGDLEDTESMKKALHGANVIFGNTDFVQFMFDPETQAQAKQQGRDVNELATEHERVQAINLMDAVASTADSLELFIYSTFSDAKGWSKGKISYNLHFDCKWAAVEHLKSTYPKIWEKTSLLQMAYFLTNWKQQPFARPHKQNDGTFKYRFPMPANYKIPLVDPNADTGNFVKALVQLPPQTNLVGVSQLISWTEWCQIWSKVNGVECTFEESDPSEIEQILAPMGLGGFGREMGDAFRYLVEFGLTGGDPTAVYPWDLDIDIPRITVEKYLQDNCRIEQLAAQSNKGAGLPLKIGQIE